MRGCPRRRHNRGSFWHLFQGAGAVVGCPEDQPAEHFRGDHQTGKRPGEQPALLRRYRPLGLGRHHLCLGKGSDEWHGQGYLLPGEHHDSGHDGHHSLSHGRLPGGFGGPALLRCARGDLVYPGRLLGRQPGNCGRRGGGEVLSRHRRHPGTDGSAVLSLWRLGQVGCEPDQQFGWIYRLPGHPFLGLGGHGMGPCRGPDHWAPRQPSGASGHRYPWGSGEPGFCWPLCWPFP